MTNVKKSAVRIFCICNYDTFEGLRKMTIKTLLASAALIASASFAQALTLTPGDSGGNFDVLAEGYDFQVSLGDTDGAASYDFTFDNNSASVAAVTISSATIGQLGSFSFFTGGADVTWTGAGTVVAAGEGVDASGSPLSPSQTQNFVAW